MSDLKKGEASHASIYCWYLHSPGKFHTSVPTFVHRDDLYSGRVTGFASLFAVDERTKEAIETAGTTKGFKGVVWTDRLWIDCDTEEAALDTYRRIEDLNLSCNEYSTGNRGSHIEIVLYNEPSHDLPSRCKSFVSENLPKADASVYTHLHLFRINGTPHELTGVRKKFEMRYERSNGQLTVSRSREPELIFASSGSGVSTSIFDCFPVMQYTTPVVLGERHSALVKLTYALRDHAKVDEAKALWWVNETNKLFSEPKTSDEVYRIVRSIFRA